MRVLLFTGKGGVGKTTTAAATATLGALRGHRTLVLSTDAAHSLADTFDAHVGPEPTMVDDRLHVQQVDAQRLFERSWGEVQGYLLGLLGTAGVDSLAAEELTVLPGAEEVLALLELRAQARSGEWDLVVVDCAPTAETLRLLALPEVLRWYVGRVMPSDRRLVRGLAPALERISGVPLPKDDVVEAVARLSAELAEVRDLLTDESASVRLVLTPESVVVAEARRALTRLSLYGYRVDGVVANRVFPLEGADAWRAQWAAAQQVQLADVEASFRGLPVWQAPYRPCEPLGMEALAHLATGAYGDDDPLAVRPVPEPLAVRESGRGWVLTLALPFAERGEVELSRRGDDLVVTVGAHRRVLALPAALARGEVSGAALRDGELRVRFRRARASRPAEPAVASAGAGAAS
jgi:arsenite/tail-anchored protein-transporting ATPase